MLSGTKFANHPIFKFLTTIVLFVLFTWSSACFAIDYPAKPLTGYVADNAEMMTPPARDQVNKILKRLNQDNKVIVYVVTIPSFAEEKAPDISIETYTDELANKWGLNTPENGNSVLFLVARDNKFARIQLGKNWKLSHAADAQHILDSTVIPEFRDGNFSAGLVKGANAIDNMARQVFVTPRPEEVSNSQVSLNRFSVWLFASIVLILIFVGSWYSFARRGLKKASNTKAKRAVKKTKIVKSSKRKK